MISAQIILIAICISMGLSSAFMGIPKPMLPPPDHRITSTILRKHPGPHDLKHFAFPHMGGEPLQEVFADSMFWGPGYEELQRHLPAHPHLQIPPDIQIPGAMKKLFSIVLRFKDVCQEDRVKLFQELGEIFKENVRVEDAEKTRLKERLIDFLVKAASIVATAESKH